MPGAASASDALPIAGSRGGRRPRSVVLAFALIGAVALGLRLWGLDFGYGQPRARPDEELFLGPALHMFGDSLNPGLLDYGFPEGFFLLLHGALRVYARVLAWWYGQEVSLGCLFALAPTRLLLVGRALSAALGTLTLVPTALLARRLVPPRQGTRAALLGALLLAVNYLHGRDSHFAVTDATLTLAVAWAAWAMARAGEDGRPAHALLAAACTGLAVAVKWTALFLVPVLGIALAVMVWRGRGSPARRSGVALLALAALVLGFVALCPHVPGSLAETWSGLVSHQMRYDPKEVARFLLDPSVDPGIGLVFHSRVTLPIALGWPGLVAAATGLAFALRRRAPGAWTCLLVLVFLYGAAVGPTRLLFVRYCLPVMPVLAALAAAGVVYAHAVLTPRRLPRASGVVLATLVVLVALPPAARLVRADLLLASADTRDLAARWLLAHAPTATVVPEVAYTDVYALDGGAIAACNAVLPPALRGLPPRLPATATRWAREVERGRAGWGAIADGALIGYWAAAGVSLDPDYLTQGTPVLSCGKPGSLRGLEALDPRCYTEVARFGPGTPPCGAVFDLFDQFYLPLAGFDGVERPGPEVAIFENRCGRGRGEPR
jgi:hypothetical protein